MSLTTDATLVTDENGYPQFVVRMDPGSAWQALNALLRQAILLEAYPAGLELRKTRDAIAAIREATGWPEPDEPTEGENRELWGR